MTVHPARVVGWDVRGEIFCSPCSPTNQEDEDTFPIWSDETKDRKCSCCGEPLGSDDEPKGTGQKR
jgi:hypothetical protein